MIITPAATSKNRSCAGAPGHRSREQEPVQCGRLPCPLPQRSREGGRDAFRPVLVYAEPMRPFATRQPSRAARNRCKDPSPESLAWCGRQCRGSA